MPSREKLSGCTAWCQQYANGDENAHAHTALSQFVRLVLIAKLRALGIEVRERLADAPSRLGKGGPRKKDELPLAAGPANREVLKISDRKPARYPFPSKKRHAKKT